MQDEAARLGQQITDLLAADCTRRLFGANTKAGRLTISFAILDVPFAAVRRHISANGIPPPQVIA